MLVTKKTKTKDLLPLLNTQEKIDMVLEAIEPYPLDKDLLSMNIEEFSHVILEEEDYIKELLSEKRAYKALGKLKSYRKQMEQLTKWMEKLEVKQSQDEKTASLGVDFPDMIQRMLITVTKFFGLKSFSEAEKCLISDYLLIYMDQSSDVKFQRNYQKLLESRQNLKKK